LRNISLHKETIEETEYSIGTIKRRYYYSGELLGCVDEHLTSGVKFHYIYLNNLAVNNKISLFIKDKVGFVEGSDAPGRYPKIKLETGSYYLWIPAKGRLHRIGADGRLSGGSPEPLQYKFNLDNGFQIELSPIVPDQNTAIFTCILLPVENAEIILQLENNLSVEGESFRKSSWFYAHSPDDIWNYLLYGSIYDPRTHQSIGKQFKCQQCAFAWWTYFGYLYRSTGKKWYNIMQDEIAFSALCDLEEDGAWRHGFWSDDMETHSRFHLDGINMLISQYEKDKNYVWLEKALYAMRYSIEHLTDPLKDEAIWFLHDSIEDKRNHKFHSNLFGKNRFNSLCLNTHVQALTVLRRLIRHDHTQEDFSPVYKRAKSGLRLVLEYQPAEFTYKILMPLTTVGCIDRNTPSFIRKISATVSGKFYWKIRRSYPRLVMPNGFIERDLNLTKASDRYHVINIKDLLMLYDLDREEWLVPYIVNGVQFLRNIIKQCTLETLLRRSPYYIEYIDILILYSGLIEKVSDEELQTVETTIANETGGFSLDSTTLYENYQRNFVMENT
jgi:hypothetical protein